MNNQLKIIFSSVFLVTTVFCVAQEKDTLTISPQMLVLKNLKPGKSTYVVYNKMSKTSPEEHIFLAKINVESKIYNNKPAIIITQNLDMDTVVHSAFTVLSAKDFSTIEHDFFWKRLGYSVKFNFETKNVSYEGAVPDSVKSNS
ncbi:MAG TPA: hypothetical protein VHZ50_10085, partial [Puia sp.]|nr:hypothetical protein [Puia sp.]